jgi:hypothetical protein
LVAIDSWTWFNVIWIWPLHRAASVSITASGESSSGANVTASAFAWRAFCCASTSWPRRSSSRASLISSTAFIRATACAVGTGAGAGLLVSGPTLATTTPCEL